MQHPESDDEPDDYWTVRFEAACDAGLDPILAAQFAEGTATLKMLRECVAGGASVSKIAEIVV